MSLKMQGRGKYEFNFKVAEFEISIRHSNGIVE